MFFSKASLVLATLSQLTLSKAQTAPDLTNSLKLQEIAYGGPGCPQGSLKFAELLNPHRFITITNGFTAAVGSTAAVSDQRKACQINILLNYPQNVQFTVANSTYSGYANLGNGVNGTHTMTVYFSGQEFQKSFSDTLQGAIDEKFTVYKNTHLDKTDLWSPCGTPVAVNIVNEITITQTGTGTLYDSGIMDIGLVWRTC